MCQYCGKGFLSSKAKGGHISKEHQSLAMRFRQKLNRVWIRRSQVKINPPMAKAEKEKEVKIKVEK